MIVWECLAKCKDDYILSFAGQTWTYIVFRYMSDEFVYKGLPSANLHQSYDGTMVIEETVEMVEIDSEQPTFEFDGTQVTIRIFVHNPRF